VLFRRGAGACPLALALAPAGGEGAGEGEEEGLLLSGVKGAITNDENVEPLFATRPVACVRRRSSPASGGACGGDSRSHAQGSGAARGQVGLRQLRGRCWTCHASGQGPGVHRGEAVEAVAAAEIAVLGGDATADALPEVVALGNELFAMLTALIR
jgi:hypothetical protein